jgi:hypothetical protein
LSIDADELSQPVCEVDPAEAGVRRDAESWRGAAARCVTSSLRSLVMSEMSAGCPQDGQNRLPGGTGALQCGQNTAEL